MKAASTTNRLESMELLLRALKLPGFAHHAEQVAQTAQREGWSYGQFLHHLAETEVEERRLRRVERSLKESRLPAEKTLATLDRNLLPARVQKMVTTLCSGDFVARAENVLAFGLPGRGKTHLLCGIGHELIQRGHRVLFVPTYLLVQQLLAAKKDLRLERHLTHLDRYDVVLLDDIGYVQQSREVMEVLFTFLAQRYERRSVMITSNLVFSEWDRIFKDAMTTAAAIDRLVHHSIILEMNGSSYRSEAARKRAGAATTKTDATTTTSGEGQQRTQTVGGEM